MDAIRLRGDIWVHRCTTVHVCTSYCGSSVPLKQMWEINQLSFKVAQLCEYLTWNRKLTGAKEKCYRGHKHLFMYLWQVSMKYEQTADEFPICLTFQWRMTLPWEMQFGIIRNTVCVCVYERDSKKQPNSFVHVGSCVAAWGVQDEEFLIRQTLPPDYYVKLGSTDRCP